MDRRDEDKADPAAEAPSRPARERPPLLTSADIFGDVLEDLGEQRPAASEPPPPSTPARSGPIKVQVGEPGGARGELSGTGEGLDEDLKALLDAFDEPHAPPTPPAESFSFAEEETTPAPPPPEADPVAPDVALAGPEPVVEAPPAPLPTPDEVRMAPDPERLLHQVLGQTETVKVKRSPRVTSPEEALKDLMNLRQPKRAPEVTTAVFQAAPPRSAAGKALDLAMVVEEALTGGPTPPPALLEPPAPSPVRVGGSYGPYKLLSKLAVGGMAEVFRAKRAGVEGFEKVVAVKRILPHLSDNKEFVDMFINEAKMVAGLTHPNIVQIFDLGKIDKSYYIAMEYVHGRDLRTILRRAKEKGLRLPLDLSVFIVAQVCSSLEFAHRKKDEQARPMMIVHRDVSPQNILISFEGDVKLTDFGIAKAASKATSTDVGALRGKLLYMSPEQAWGKAMDRRSDLFSLGIVFYEMVTDQRPFLASSEMSILEMVRDCRVRAPSELNPRLPERLEKVLMKALERDPDSRYQDAGEMFRDLERVRFERPQPPTQIELARYLELLFEESERSDALPAEEAAPAEEHLDPEPPSPAAPAGGAARDPMTVEQLLKRFGIK
jgi:serine/threonine protein kinase